MGFFGRHNTVTRADKISEFTVNTAEYGTAVPEVLGTTRLSGNVIYYDDFTAHEHSETHKSGKGGGSKSTSITYTYTVACILGLCEGEITGIGKVWRGKEVYTYPNEKIELTAFLGTQTQEPWAYVVGNHPEKAMPYKGLAYMAGVVDMGDSASLPQYNFEIKGKLLNTGDGVDVNPADYIRYVLDKVGLESVEIEGLDNYRTYCREADLLISSPPDSKPAQAQNIVNEIAKLTNAYFFWSNDRFKIVPLETRNIGSWEADTTIKYDLTSDDFSPQSKGAMVTYSRKDSSEVYNSFPVEFINRENAYEKETVNYQLSEDIRQNGLRQASSTAAHYFYTKERAVKVAEMLAKKSVNEKNTYTFTLNWAFALLEPGDIVTLTDKNIGIDHLPVRIATTTENEKGKITCTAVAVDIASGVAQYDIHGADRPYVNFNIIPPNTIPCIIQPPADLTVDGLELWIGGRGADDGWGGCTVYISDDNINYRTVGQINNSARTGALQSDMTADATSCIVSCNDVLLSGTQQDAERGNTLVWIGGECLSYTTATLLQNGNYQLDGLIRGQYNTTATAHSAREQFARLDNTLLKESFRKEDIGKKLYLKFCSYNIFGAAEQSLADVNAYEYTLLPYYIPPVTELTARNRYRKLKDGVHRYDIVVEWTPPNLQSYLEGRVWYKTNAGQSKSLTFQKDVPSSEAGFSGEWIFGGSGKNTVVIPQALVGDTYRIAVTTTDVWGVETSPDASPQIEILVALKTETPNTPDGFAISFGAAAVAEWSEVANTDIAYYEVRNDTNHGIESINLLARVTGLTATLPLTQRSGTLYLYAYSASGKYSAPAILEYNKPSPPTPNAPTLTNKLGGFALVAGAIPSGCNGMNIYIDGAELVQVHTENNTYTHTCDAGIYDVSIAYTDIFGEGTHSEESRITIKATVDSALLEAQAVTRAKLETALQDAVDDAVQSAQDIVRIDGDISSLQTRANGIIAELNKTPAQSSYNSIAGLKTITDNIISDATTNYNTLSGRITANTTDIQQNESDITALASRTDDTEDDIAALQVRADGIAATVASNKTTQDAWNSSTSSSISTIQQNATSLATTVANNKTTQDGINSSVASQITQNADSITAITTKLGSAPDATGQYAAIVQLKQSVTGLETQVEEIYEMTDEGIAPDIAAMKSQIQQNSRSIETVVSNLNASASGNTYASISSLSQRADSIASTVASNKTAQDAINDGTSSSGLKTLIETNASNITQTANGVSAIVTKLNSTTGILDYDGVSALSDEIAAVDLKADEISSTVTSNKAAQDEINAGTSSSGLLTKINSNTTKITQNTNSISALVTRVSDAETDIAAVDVKADNISSTVASNKTAQDKINAGTSSSGLLTKINQNASGISAVATSVDTIEGNLNDSTKARSYTAIQVMQDGIASKVTQDDVTSYFQQDHTGFYIKGSLINIDGTTKIGNNVITKNMIQTGAVTADKIAVDKLSAINANVGALKGGTITGTTIIGSTIRNADSSFVVDSKGNIKGAKLTAGTIEANMITSAGFRVKSATIIEGTVSGNNGLVPLPSGYTWEQCLCTAYVDNDFAYYNTEGGYEPMGTRSYLTVVTTSNGKRLRVRSVNYDNDSSGDYVSVPYRVIGIK